MAFWNFLNIVQSLFLRSYLMFHKQQPWQSHHSDIFCILLPHFFYFLFPIIKLQQRLPFILLWILRLAVGKLFNPLLPASKDADWVLGVITVCPPAFSPFGLERRALIYLFTLYQLAHSALSFLVHPLSISWATGAVFDTEGTKSDE